MKGAALLSIVASACFSELAYGLDPPANPRILNPGITPQPQNQTVIAGQSATFTVTVTGNVPLSYRWTFNGSNVGSSSSAYTRANCQLADNGGRVQVTVSNASGSVQSSTATLTVNPTGTTYYVATNGSSGNTGLSTNSPWTLRKGISHLGPDVTVIMMPGAYTGPVTIHNITNGTAGHPATLKSLTKWGAVIANSPTYGIACGFTPYVSYLVIDGLCVSNSLASDGVGMTGNHITVRNCWIVKNYMQGINDSNPNCSNNVIEYNLVENNGTISIGNPSNFHYHGMYVTGPNTIVRGNVVRNNNNGIGIDVYTGYPGVHQDRIFVYNNLVYGHTNLWGMTMWGAIGEGSDYGLFPGTNYIFGNTIVDGLACYFGTVNITNNIILASQLNSTTRDYPIWSSDVRPLEVQADYNCGTNAITPAGTHDIIINVDSSTLFANASKGRYWLAESNPARGAAFPTVCGPVDFFGNAQSSVTDVGAFQYKATLAGDIRVLDPSPANPDYWSLP